MLQGEGPAGVGRQWASSGPLALALAAVVLAITATAAHAASTRAEYVAQVDPICQAAIAPETKALAAFNKALKDFRQQSAGQGPSRRDRNRFLRRGARFFGVVSRVESSVTSQISAVPPAPGDENAVAAWLQKRNETVALLNRAIAALKHHKLRAFLNLVDQAEAAAETGEFFVAVFGFKYCVSP